MNAVYTTMERGAHALHECRNAEEFRVAFEATTGQTIEQVVSRVVSPTAPTATFAVGSLALGMGTSGSDVDLIVLVESADALLHDAGSLANNAQELEYSSESRLLRGIFLKMYQGVLVDLSVVITSEIHRVYQRLRRRGPELSEIEIRILGRLSSGWLLSQTDGYMDRNASILKDPALPIYCCTREYVSALHQISKAERALARADLPLALQHARESVEYCYIAYFASEGLTYLGSKWLAQLGHAHGAAERLERHPLLGEGIALLFPHYPTPVAAASDYLKNVARFLTSMRQLIERKSMFKIAFSACPQVHSLQ
jgi:hypothetical protein